MDTPGQKVRPNCRFAIFLRSSQTIGAPPIASAARSGRLDVNEEKKNT